VRVVARHVIVMVVVKVARAAVVDDKQHALLALRCRFFLPRRFAQVEFVVLAL